MGTELECGKEWPWRNLRYNHDILLTGLRKTTTSGSRAEPATFRLPKNKCSSSTTKFAIYLAYHLSSSMLLLVIKKCLGFKKCKNDILCSI